MAMYILSVPSAYENSFPIDTWQVEDTIDTQQHEKTTASRSRERHRNAVPHPLSSGGGAYALSVPNAFRRFILTPLLTDMFCTTRRISRGYIVEGMKTPGFLEYLPVLRLPPLPAVNASKFLRETKPAILPLDKGAELCVLRRAFSLCTAQ